MTICQTAVEMQVELTACDVLEDNTEAGERLLWWLERELERSCKELKLIFPRTIFNIYLYMYIYTYIHTLRVGHRILVKE